MKKLIFTLVISLFISVRIFGQVTCLASYASYLYQGSTYHFYENAQTGAQNHYHWDFGDGTTLDTTYSGSFNLESHTFTSNGSFNVCLYVYDIDTNHDTLCTDHHCTTVTITTAATCVASFADYVYQGLTYHFYQTATTGNQNNYHWIFGDGTSFDTTGNLVSHTYPGNGTYNACLIVYDINPTSHDTLCANYTCHSLSIGPGDTCVASFGYYFVSGTNYHFYENAQTGDQNWYHWNWGDGTTMDTAYLYPFHSFPGNGVYHVCMTAYHIDTLTHDTLCSKTLCDTITIGTTATCVASFAGYLYQGFTYHFYENASTGNQNNYHWVFGDGTSLDTSGHFVSHNYPGNGTYNVCLIVYDINPTTHDTLCANYSCQTITIGATCVASFSYYLYNGSTFHFYENAQSGSQNNYHWIFGDGTTLDTTGHLVSHTYPGNGMYHVCLIVYDINPTTHDTLCMNYTCHTIVIGNTCVASFGYYQYQGNVYHFYVNAQTGDQNAYHWNFGDGTTLDTTYLYPFHTFPGNGVYNVCLTVFDIDSLTHDTLCSDTLCQTITVGNTATCVASFAGYLYQGFIYHFYENAGTGDQNHYHWIFGDGTSLDTTGTFVSHVYPGNGTYNVCLIVYDINPTTHDTLCYNYTCQSITIGNLCTASFGDYQYQGSTFHFYVNAQTGSQNEYHWDFGDGTTLDTTYLYPFHTFPGNGTYNVCLTAYDINPTTHDTLCLNTICHTVTIGITDTCVASFAWYLYQGTTFHFYVNAQSGNQNAYYWDFGDSTYSSTNSNYAFHNYSGYGSYIVCLTAMDIDQVTHDTLCKATKCDTIGYHSGINEFNLASEFSVYPNPASGNVQIVNHSGMNAQMILYNYLGEAVRTIDLMKGDNNLSVNDLPSGVYVYRISAGNKIVGSDKLIVVK